MASIGNWPLKEKKKASVLLEVKKSDYMMHISRKKSFKGHIMFSSGIWKLARITRILRRFDLQNVLK